MEILSPASITEIRLVGFVGNDKMTIGESWACPQCFATRCRRAVEEAIGTRVVLLASGKRKMDPSQEVKLCFFERSRATGQRVCVNLSHHKEAALE